MCRVVVDAGMVYEDEEWTVDELTDDYFAQAAAAVGNPLDVESNVYYCGEISRNYEDGYLDNLDGSFFSGVEFSQAGVLTRQYPMVGQVDRQEYAIAEAEDVVEYLHLYAAPGEYEGSQNENHQDGDFECTGHLALDPGDCIQTKDFSPLDPESIEYKYYKAGLGFVLAVGMEGDEVVDREELVCVGPGLEILFEEQCGLLDDEGGMSQSSSYLTNFASFHRTTSATWNHHFNSDVLEYSLLHPNIFRPLCSSLAPGFSILINFPGGKDR